MLKNTNPFLERIAIEESLTEDDKFRVVKDANPLDEDHYLVYTKENYSSFADVCANDLVQFLESKVNFLLSDGYILVERGRGESCTGGKVIHAHAHIVPVKYKDSIISKLGEPDFTLVAEGGVNELLEKSIKFPLYVLVFSNSLRGSLYKLNSSLKKSVIRNIISRADVAK
ncbi:hypothetical protein [Neptunomonas concharum]|uniref:HIT domain-containing protein n=1 Tax=Neptunomonas concharum TaxID=1031538 RepID=A0A5P1RB74_9GAMM|nr:hypothetical protein [Neptunomonas concharum]QEQ96525.1 hypothetical protein F0U83_07285 [Neptunomonas concharum]